MAEWSINASGSKDIWNGNDHLMTVDHILEIMVYSSKKKKKNTNKFHNKVRKRDIDPFFLF